MNKKTVMCTTHGECRSVCTTLTAPRMKEGRASMMINCSYVYTFRLRYVHCKSFLSCCDTEIRDGRVSKLDCAILFKL